MIYVSSGSSPRPGTLDAMNARFLHPSAWQSNTAARDVPGDTAIASVALADPSGRACCCAAKAAVCVIMPPTSARPAETKLLLCGHHYRASSRALAALRVAVRQLPGTPADIAAWINLGQRTSSPTSASVAAC